MPKVYVRREAFEQGQFPPVCCKTGERAEMYRTWEFAHTPGWTWILLPLGVLPFVIASVFVTRRLRGVLPMSPRAQRRIDVGRPLVWIFAIAALLAWVLGLGTANVPILVGAGGLTLAWLAAFAATAVWSPNAKPRDDVIELTNVHRAFVDALHTPDR